MTRAISIRLLLTALAFTSVAIIEVRMAGVWPAAEIPWNVAHAPNGLWVVHPVYNHPLPRDLGRRTPYQDDREQGSTSGAPLPGRHRSRPGFLDIDHSHDITL